MMQLEEDILVPTFLKPTQPFFASGPCVKPPGWHPGVLSQALVGRSHRSKLGIDKINQVLQDMRIVLNIPASHHIALVPGSATGAMEMLMWNLLGAQPVDCLIWDVFGYRWAQDVIHQLKLADVRQLTEAQDIYHLEDHRDVVFTWNASTSGRCLPFNFTFPKDRSGLTLCDATSAAFAIPLPWACLDATAFSWQKGLGAEAGVGVIVLGPRALERLDHHRPSWAIPHLFQLYQKGRVYPGLFEGLTLNTLSLLLVEDALQALDWVKNQGGGDKIWQRTQANSNLLKAWVRRTLWIDFLEPLEDFQSPTTICLIFPTHPDWSFIAAFCDLLDQQKVAFDIKNHRAAPPSLRVWAGPTIEIENLQALLPWLEWAYEKLTSKN